MQEFQRIVEAGCQRRRDRTRIRVASPGALHGSNKDPSPNATRQLNARDLSRRYGKDAGGDKPDELSALPHPPEQRHSDQEPHCECGTADTEQPAGSA
jgi:hypothetical protein